MIKLNDIVQIDIPEDHHSTNHSDESVNVIGMVVDIMEPEKVYCYRYITLKVISSTYNGNFKHPFHGDHLDNEFVFSNDSESAGYIPEDNIKKID
jgi:hypothetical protein